MPYNLYEVYRVYDASRPLSRVPRLETGYIPKAGVGDPEVDQMKGNKKDVSEKKTRKPCGECRFYDWTTKRQFHRKVGPVDEKTGERSLIIEPRAICRGPKARARGHLVHRDQTKRPCEQWEAGKYEPPKEEEKPEELKELEKMIKKTKTDTDDEKTSPDEYHGSSEAVKKLNKSVSQWQKEIQKRNKEKSSVEENKLNGEKKTLTVKRGKIIVK